MQPTVTPVSTTAYVVEETTTTSSSLYSSKSGTTNPSNTTLANYDAKNIPSMKYKPSLGKRLAISVGKYRDFLYDTGALKTYILETSSTTLNENEINIILKVAQANKVNLKTLKETIAKASLHMNITSTNFSALQDPSTNSYDFFVIFNVDKTQNSRIAQFNNYIENYLGSIDITKSKIHVSVV